MNHLKIALTQIGVKEIPGQESNPKIDKYFTEIGQPAEKFKDDTAWCSAFANWVCLKANKEHSKRLNARSWLSIGYEVETPEIGDIVVFWRESRDSWKGHVAFFINKIGEDIYVLGGNQGNEVCIKPYKENQLLSYRRI